MSETMRERMSALWDGGRGLFEVIEPLADHADAMSLRLAALERAEVERGAVKVAPATDAPAPGPRVWPVGSFPPVAVGQFRTLSNFRIAVLKIGDGVLTEVEFAPITPWGPAQNWTSKSWTHTTEIAAAPLAEPWTEPTTHDPRIAALEAERDALAAQLATMAAEAIALRGERDAAVFRANDAEARWRTARESLDIHISERLATMAAERDAAVKLATDGSRSEARLPACIHGAHAWQRCVQCESTDGARGFASAPAGITDGAHVGASEK